VGGWWYLIVVMLRVVVLLNALRYTLDEPRGPHGSTPSWPPWPRSARLLLANMVRALEHDRHRTVT
jgi:hypothetical protein